MTNDKIVIETPRLILRKITLDDVDDFYELDSNPEVHKYLGKNPVTSKKQSRGYIESVLQQYEDYNLGRLALILKDTGEFLGWSGLKYETVIRDYGYYDIGYRLKQQYWGKGYAKESAIASLAYGFDTLKFDRICGGAEVDNLASNKILKSIGLKFVETFEFENEPHHWYELQRQDY